MTFTAILGRFSDALALLETVEHVFVATEEGASGPKRQGIAAVGAQIATLGRAIKEAKSVYSEFDLALVVMAKASR